MTTPAKMVCVPSPGMVTFSAGVTSCLVDGGLQAHQGQRLGRHYLLVVGPLAHDDGAPRGGGVDCGLDGPERGGAAGPVGVVRPGVPGDVQGAVVTVLPCDTGGRQSRLGDQGPGDQ